MERRGNVVVCAYHSQLPSPSSLFLCLQHQPPDVISGCRTRDGYRSSCCYSLQRPHPSHPHLLLRGLQLMDMRVCCQPVSIRPCHTSSGTSSHRPPPLSTPYSISITTSTYRTAIDRWHSSAPVEQRPAVDDGDEVQPASIVTTAPAAAATVRW